MKMKMNHNFKKILSMFILLIFLIGLLTPTSVFAIDNVKAGNTINLSIERKVLGEGDVLNPVKETINQGEKASVSIDRILKSLNIDYKNAGSLDKKFYISSIKTPEGEFLSEFNHGSVSGWKYSVNGVYPNVGFSDYEFKDGDNVKLQYTAKDMGQDILVVDTIYKIREKLKDSEKISKDKYTEESFKHLQGEITKVKAETPSDKQIGEMMSDILGTGDCNTYDFGIKMDKILKGLEMAIGGLQEKPAEPAVPNVKPEFNIKMIDSWYPPNPNTVYLAKGQKSVWAAVDAKEKNKPVIFDGKEIPVVNDKALIEFKPGIHKLSMKMWSMTKEIEIECKPLPYKIEGNAYPGGTVTIDFNSGVEEGLKNSSTYQLKETTLQYKTNILGLKNVSSETVSGGNVDKNKLSKITFTIPKDTQPGDYDLTSGSIYQKWGGTSFGNGGLEGKFSVFPNLKLTVTPKIDLSKACDINLNNWSKFDKVYTLEDSILLKLKDVNTSSKVLVNGETINPVGDVYAAKLPVGDNLITVDGKEYKVICKKVTYKISNANEIIPGSEVTVQFNGLEKAFSYIAGQFNPHLVKTVYKTNVPELETAESKKAGSYTDVNDEILNKITFTVPKDAKQGMYELSNGSIYQEWYGTDVPGKTDGNFSRLPKVQFQVRDSIQIDKAAPEISTNLNDNATVSKGKLRFKVIVSDNVDSVIKPIVKLNNKVAEGNTSGEYTVDLNEGANNIKIEAIDAAGNKTTKTYLINFKVKLREGANIILDTLNVVLNTGAAHQIIAVDTPDNRSNEDEDTAKMSYTVISGNDVVTVNKLGLVTALKPGMAEVSVRYPGLTTPALVHIHVKGEKDANGPKVTTSIEENKYDTLYYSGDAYDYNFSVNASDSDVTVMFNDKEVSKDSNGKYNIKLTEGYNFIKITSTKGSATTYENYNLRAKKSTVNIENLTNPGQAIVKGDKVKASFKGIETPVPKFLRVYNPKRTRVEYKTDMPGATNIYGNPTQYAIATNNAIVFTVNTVGTFNFTGGNIEESWWGDKLFRERDISGEGPNTGAVVLQNNFSKLPNFTLEIKENKDYNNKYTAEILNKEPIKAGDEVTLKIKNLEIPEADKGRVIQAITVFNTDIPSLKEIKSEDAASDQSKLQTIKFKVPADTKAGTYIITNGRVFKEWEGGVLWVDSEFYKGELPVVKLVVTGEEVKPELPVIDINKPKLPVVDINKPKLPVVDINKPKLPVIDINKSKPSVVVLNKPVNVVKPTMNVKASVQTLVGLTALGVNPKSKNSVERENWIGADIINVASDNGGYKHSIDNHNSGDGNNGKSNKAPINDNQSENTNKPSKNKGSSNNSGSDNGLIVQGESGNNSNSDKTENTEDKADKKDDDSTKEAENKEEISSEEIKPEVNKVDDTNKDLVNSKVGTKKQPLSNIKVVILTLILVFVLLALKKVAVKQYGKKKSQQ